MKKLSICGVLLLLFLVGCGGEPEMETDTETPDIDEPTEPTTQQEQSSETARTEPTESDDVESDVVEDVFIDEDTETDIGEMI